MLRKVLVGLILLIISQSFGQEINQLNADGERIGIWQKYYSNKGLRYEGKFENGKEVGVFQFYSINNSKYPMVIKRYNPEDEQVLVQFFSSTGVLESEGYMIDKSRVGTWLYYHKNSKSIMIEETYENGNLNGVSKLFYKTRQLAKIENFKDGKLHGSSKQYSEQGVLTDNLIYENGELNGLVIFYETNGNIKQRGRYKNDIKVGMWEYYEAGVLKETKDLNYKRKKD